MTLGVDTLTLGVGVKGVGVLSDLKVGGGCVVSNLEVVCG